MTHAYGPPSLADTASMALADHPTLALAASAALVVVLGAMLATVGGWISEAWAYATDAVAKRWPRLATVGARWRAEEARRHEAARVADERRQAMQLCALLALAAARR